jgi:hypothetical protein
MLLCHVAHLAEEACGGFWLIGVYLGLPLFIVINLALFSVPVVLFCYVIRDKRWAYRLGIVYAGVMILNGIAHNLGTLLTGKYSGSFAGGYTGLGLIIIGLLLISYLGSGLRRHLKRERCETDQ